MKSIFQWKLTILAMIISLGCAWPILLGNTQYSVAAPKKIKLKVRSQPKAPPSRGFPAVPEAAISRGNCLKPGAKLVALAPKFVQKALNNGDIDEQSVWGQTTIERPTVWFFVPFIDRSTQLEFSLQNREDEEVYSAVIPTPAKDGVIGVKIKSQKPLELNQHYHWTLKAKIFCGASEPETKFVDGWIQRVDLPKGIDIATNPTQVYVDRGVWYDAVTSLAQQRLQEPNNIQLQQDWKDLLGLTHLKKITRYPLLP